MGLFDKLKAKDGNTLYGLIRKKLIADGKEHVIIKDTVALGDKTYATFEEFMAGKGFEVLDVDVNPSALGKGFQSIKVKYRSKD